jgi:hypothetical protein
MHYDRGNLTVEVRNGSIASIEPSPPSRPLWTIPDITRPRAGRISPDQDGKTKATMSLWSIWAAFGSGIRANICTGAF